MARLCLAMKQTNLGRQERARAFVRDHHLSRGELALRLQLPYWWVQKFATGQIQNGDPDRIDAILTYASKERRSTRKKAAA